MAVRSKGRAGLLFREDRGGAPQRSQRARHYHSWQGKEEHGASLVYGVRRTKIGITGK
jgi:hypothetical protein